jgi:membrane-associated phospholipid phosphatase
MRRWPALREILVLGTFALCYGLVRTLTEGSVGEAMENAEHVLHVEQALGFAWEEGAQAAIIGSDTAVAVANWTYIWGYFPFVISAAVFLWCRHRAEYLVLRNAVLVSGAVGLVVFAAFPTAPPRLTDMGVVDTILEQSRSYRLIQPPELTNQYAAMPSLHVGWSLLVGLTLAGVASNRLLRLGALGLPVAMAVAVVATANHFVLDVLAGVLVVAGAWWVSVRFTPLTEGGAAATLLGRDEVERPVRRGPPSGERHPSRPAGGGAGRRPGRGGRAAVSRPARGAAPEDARPAARPVGSLAARKPARRAAAAARRPGADARRAAHARPQG